MGESGAATVEHGVEVPVRISLSLGVLFIRIAFFFSSVLGPAAELVPSSAARARRRSAVRRMAVVGSWRVRVCGRACLATGRGGV